MRSFAAFVAHALFQAMRLGRYLGRHAVLLAVVGVMQVATIWAVRGSGPHLEGQIGAQATFIAANGTTAQNWNIGGPNGPNWTNSSGTSVISAATQMSVDGPITAVGPSVANQVLIGNSTAEPSIAIGDYNSTAAQRILVGALPGNTSRDSISIIAAPTGGGVAGLPVSLQIQSSNFTLAGGSGDTLTLGTAGTHATLTPTELLLGYGSVTTSSFAGGLVSINANITNVNGQIYITSTSTLSCGTGGTITIPQFSVVPISTGTLSSNCVLDFGPNASQAQTFLDMSAATPGATFGIVFKNGAATQTFTSVTHTDNSTLAIVSTYGTNTLAVSY